MVVLSNDNYHGSIKRMQKRCITNDNTLLDPSDTQTWLAGKSPVCWRFLRENHAKIEDCPCPRLSTKRYTVDDCGWKEDVVLKYHGY